MVNKELTEQYRGKRYRDGDTVLIVSHVIQIHVLGGARFEVVYDREPAQENSAGRGSCWVDDLQRLPEIPA